MERSVSLVTCLLGLSNVCPQAEWSCEIQTKPGSPNGTQNLPCKMNFDIKTLKMTCDPVIAKNSETISQIICKPKALQPTTTPKPTPTTPTSKACEDGWSEHNGYCYKTFNNADKPSTHNEAEASCKANSGNLASIHSQAEQDFVGKLVTDTSQKITDEAINRGRFYYWLGMKLGWEDVTNLKKVAWTDGTAVDFADPKTSKGKKPWDAEKPKNELEKDDNCVFMYGNEMEKLSEKATEWNDGPCDNDLPPDTKDAFKVRGYVCKKKTSGSTPSPTSTTPKPATTTPKPATTTPTPPICQAGWSELKGNCYKAFDNPTKSVKQDEAETECKANSGNLVSIHSQEEQDFVGKLVSETSQKITDEAINRGRFYFWLGMKLGWEDVTNLKKVAWTDGTPVNFADPKTSKGKKPWDAEKPKNELEKDDNCVFMYGNEMEKLSEKASEWNDGPCDNDLPPDTKGAFNVRGFVCKKKGQGGGGGNPRLIPRPAGIS